MLHNEASQRSGAKHEIFHAFETFSLKIFTIVIYIVHFKALTSFLNEAKNSESNSESFF